MIANGLLIGLAIGCGYMALLLQVERLIARWQNWKKKKARQRKH